MADPSGQPVVHGLKPMDFDDDLIDAYTCLHHSKLLQKHRRATCTLHVYIACPPLAYVNSVRTPEAECGS